MHQGSGSGVRLDAHDNAKPYSSPHACIMASFRAYAIRPYHGYHVPCPQIRIAGLVGTQRAVSSLTLIRAASTCLQNDIVQGDTARRAPTMAIVCRVLVNAYPHRFHMPEKWHHQPDTARAQGCAKTATVSLPWLSCVVSTNPHQGSCRDTALCPR